MLSIPELIGSEYSINTANGQRVKYLNLDNAATTPTFKHILNKVAEFLTTYGSIHRGSGQKSQISTSIYEEAVPVILGFLGVTKKEYALISAHNTTASINKLARMLDITENDTIFLSEFEHSANDLPWRKKGSIVRIPADDNGSLDMDFFVKILRSSSKKGKKIIAISGASNITGALTPIHEIAKLAHEYGAVVMVDAAQLVAHREINLAGKNPVEAIDFICFSGHKMYAPFGGGMLVGRRELLEKMQPDDVGGGNVDFVTNDSYDLARDFFKRSTPGTPNVLGLVSMALSCLILKNQIGFDEIFDHEQAILKRAKERFANLINIETYCDLEYDARNKCSVLAFNVVNRHPGLVAARLGHEFGIGVRQGAICQFSYVAKLLGIDQNELQVIRADVLSGKYNQKFGIVRASFGIGNTEEDVDRLVEAIVFIEKSPEKDRDYIVNGDGEFWPNGKPMVDTTEFYKL